MFNSNTGLSFTPNPTNPMTALSSSISPSPQSPSKPSPRSDCFKYNEKNLKELRRRRSETVVELRKQRKDGNKDQLRQLSSYDYWSDCEDNDEEEEDFDINRVLLRLQLSNSLAEIPAKYIRYIRTLLPKGREVRSVDERTLLNELTSDLMIIKCNDCLTNENSSLALLQEVVGLMAQMCSLDSNQTIILVKTGIVDNLLNLLSFDCFKVMEESVLGLTYIWKSCPETKQMVNSSKFLDHLLSLIDSETSVSPSKYNVNDGRIELIRTISWSLRIMTQTADQNAYSLSVGLNPYFVKLLNISDNETTINVLKSLSATTERIGTVEQDESSPIRPVVQSIVNNSSLFALIISCLSAKEDDIVLNAIRIIGNIVSLGEVWTQIVIQNEVLNRFPLLLEHRNPCVQREVAFTVSNITAGNFTQIQTVMDSNIIKPIVNLLYFGDYRSQVEACHALLNITALGSVQQILYLLNIGNTIPDMDVIAAMATLLSITDPNVIQNCLKFYNNLLLFGKKIQLLKEVRDRCELSSVSYWLERLINDRNTQVAVLATHVVDKYFSDPVAEEKDNVMNVSTGSEGEKSLNFSF